MRTTVSELKLKLCHRTLANDTFETCEGPRCMAWRWGRMPENRRMSNYSQRRATTEPERPAYVPASFIFVPFDEVDGTHAHWLETDEEAEARRTGYCGLAGVPEHA